LRLFALFALRVAPRIPDAHPAGKLPRIGLPSFFRGCPAISGEPDSREPARATRCAGALRDRTTALGTPVRAGPHTGECELIDGKIAGIAVRIGARVANHAQPGGAVPSSTVKDFVAGSGLRFSEGNIHTLQGVPRERRLSGVGQAQHVRCGLCQSDRSPKARFCD